MIANHIHDALSQVRQLQELILRKKKFNGYSGRARMAGGLTALFGAFILSHSSYASRPIPHLIGWGAVLALALALNYIALLRWFFFHPDARRNPVCLLPALDAVPALAIGAVLSVSAILYQQYQFLFGIWMSMYGLVHMNYRHSLPKANYLVGIFYMASGAVCLLYPGLLFTNPWPMGLVFFIGEITGGFIFFQNRTRLKTSMNPGEAS